MKSDFNPARLDVSALAAAGASHSGQVPLSSLERLTQSADASAGLGAREVHWSVQGERRTRTGSEPETWMHLQAWVTLPLTCQRCLQPVDRELEVDTRLRFVHGEAEAARLDAEIEEDVLPLARHIDLTELIEDELLLALPLVPMHDACPAPLLAETPAEAAESKEASVHPFAALQSLKVPRAGH